MSIKRALLKVAAAVLYQLVPEPKRSEVITTIPKMARVPDGASVDVREKMFWDHMDAIVRWNPNGFLPIGVKKRWWHILKTEHPRTRELEIKEKFSSQRLAESSISSEASTYVPLLKCRH